MFIFWFGTDDLSHWEVVVAANPDHAWSLLAKSLSETLREEVSDEWAKKEFKLYAETAVKGTGTVASIFVSTDPTPDFGILDGPNGELVQGGHV